MASLLAVDCVLSCNAASTPRTKMEIKRKASLLDISPSPDQANFTTQERVPLGPVLEDAVAREILSSEAILRPFYILLPKYSCQLQCEGPHLCRMAILTPSELAAGK